jgi:hypothetical protein
MTSDCASPTANNKIELQRCFLFGNKDYVANTGNALTITLTDYNAMQRFGSVAQSAISTFMGKTSHFRSSFLVPTSPLIDAVGASVDTDPRPTKDVYRVTKDYTAAQDLGAQQYIRGNVSLPGLPTQGDVANGISYGIAEELLGTFAGGGGGLLSLFILGVCVIQRP